MEALDGHCRGAINMACDDPGTPNKRKRKHRGRQKTSGLAANEVDSVVVQTQDSVRYAFWLDQCSTNARPRTPFRLHLLACGPTGTGKTLQMQGTPQFMHKTD